MSSASVASNVFVLYADNHPTPSSAEDDKCASLLRGRSNFRPFAYPEAYAFLNAQDNHFWTHLQIEVSSDVSQYHTAFTEAEKHGINTVLKLFTTYEVHVANYWLDVVYASFPHPEVRMMAQSFASMEAQHALFYDKLNDALNLSTKDFYLSFMQDPAMRERMDLIAEYIEMGKSDDVDKKALSLATFSFIEGVILYSSFAFLMSFQQPPKNKLMNIFTGLSYSVRDENIHSEAGSWLYNTFTREEGVDLLELEPKVLDIAHKAFELESVIIDNIFSNGRIEGITEYQLKEFVKSRVNKKLKDIGISPLFEVKYNPIASWFYKSINAVEFTDFFSRSASAYTNNWNFGKIQQW